MVQQADSSLLRASTGIDMLDKDRREKQKNTQTQHIKAFLDFLPPWVLLNLRNPKSWKLFLRSWVGSWAALVLFLPDKSLRVLGNTAFFTLLSSIFLPAYLPIQMFFILVSTLVIGIMLGWGIGAAAMRAALASRSQVLLMSTLEKVQSSAAGLADPEALFTADIFQGMFLDVRSSIVFGCFLGLGTFIFALVRAYAPGLTMMSVFGTIALDIYCTFGPLFPTGEYNILNSLLTSVASYVAIAVVVSVLIFPETSNHSCLSGICAQLDKLKGLLEIQFDVLNSTPEDLSPDKALLKRILALRAAVIGGQQQLTAKSKYISSEVSWGKWSGDDVKGLEEPLLAIMVRIVGLQNFARLVGKPQLPPCPESNHPNQDSITTSSVSVTREIEQPQGVNDTYLLRHLAQRNRLAEANHTLEIQHMLPLLKESTSDLREACAHGLVSVKETLDFINKYRWRRNPNLDGECSKSLDDAIERLSAVLSEFKDSKRMMLLQPYSPFLGSTDQQEMPLRSLYLTYVFAANLISVAHVTLGFMEKVRDKVIDRRNNRLWLPKGVRAIGKIFTARGDEEDITLGEDPADADIFTDEDTAYRKDPDSRPPTNMIQKTMNSLHLLYKWSGTPEAKFTIKYTIVSVLLWLPSVFHSSAQFYYVQKGVWALIMAQTTMNIYASDQIFNYVIRLVGTFVGLCLGLVTWYIGSGRGIGNPYGVAASSAVFLIPVVWLRLFAPPKYLPGVLIGGVRFWLFCLTEATFALVVGYSWIDGHLQTVGNPGIGWSIAWRRWVLVVIGCAASFIMMMLPPTSGRKAVRLRNAAVISKISNMYAFLVSTWIETEHHEKPSRRAHASEAWLSEFRLRLKALAEQVQSVRQLTDMAKWEGNIRGAWPLKEYNELADAESEMLNAIAQLGSAIAHLDGDWRIKFLHKTKVVHPNFISDVLTKFTVVSQSLRTGEAMHQVLPRSLLDRLFYHNRIANIPNVAGEDSVDVEALRSLDYVYYASGIVAVFQLLMSLDEVHSITKRLCGEVPLHGYERWKEQYEQTHVLA